MEEPTLYQKLISFLFLFFVHMLGDILVKLNKLNKVLQFNHIDITHIGRNWNICTTILIHQYLFHRVKAFWRDFKFFDKFLKAIGVFSYVGYPFVEGTKKIYPLCDGHICD